MAALDGEWTVRRTGGLLPPLAGVRKRIRDGRGETAIGPFPGVPFTVHGLELQYRLPFGAFVDVLEPVAGGGRFRGRALVAGREYGTFELVRA